MGLATARLFAERGWRVAAYDVDRAALDALAGELGETHVTRPLDVTDADDFGRAVAELAEVTGERLDLLFNNAGVAESGWFEDVPQEAALRVIGVNYIGAVNGIYAEVFSESPPARATIEASRLPAGARVEMDAVARIPETRG